MAVPLLEATDTEIGADSSARAGDGNEARNCPSHARLKLVAVKTEVSLEKIIVDDGEDRVGLATGRADEIGSKIRNTVWSGWDTFVIHDRHVDWFYW